MTTIQWGEGPQLRLIHDEQALSGEHGALTRQLAALQDRVSRQIADQADQVQRLQAEVMRLRGRLLQARTALLWGLARGGQNQASPPAHRRVVVGGRLSLEEDASPEAHAVICQTGCAGHAHPWLEADGLCRRTGSACEAGTTSEEALTPVSPLRADR